MSTVPASLNTQIQDAIKAHLPAQVGDALKSELAALASARESIIKLNAEVDRLNKLAQSRLDETARLGSELMKHQDLSVRERNVSERELANKISEAVLAEKMSCADKLKEMPMQVLGMMFANRTMREETLNNVVTCGGTYPHSSWNGNQQETVPMANPDTIQQVVDTKTTTHG